MLIYSGIPCRPNRWAKSPRYYEKECRLLGVSFTMQDWLLAMKKRWPNGVIYLEDLEGNALYKGNSISIPLSEVDPAIAARIHRVTWDA